MTKCNRFKHLITILLFIAGGGDCLGMAYANASSKDSTFQVLLVTPQFGVVVPHHDDMVYFVNDFSYGMDINFGIKIQ